MQFAYQYPERTERLMLVDSGGLGKEVTPFIRALGLPFAMATLAFLTLPGVRQLNKATLRALHRVPTAVTRDLAEVAEIVESLKDPRTRYALHRLVESAIDVRGQVISMRDRAYLTAAMPICVLWGEDDLVLPVHHAHVIATLAPNARVVVQKRSGHFPHKDHPEAFVELVDEFMAIPPATYSRARWRRLLKTGTAPALEPVNDETA
jgi:pimeloyl-ACP methyl ester carboxylesterase